MATKFLFAHKMTVLENRPIMLCGLLNKCTSCMPMDCVSCEVLLKKKQHSAMVLAANLVILSMDLMVLLGLNIKINTLKLRYIIKKNDQHNHSGNHISEGPN